MAGIWQTGMATILFRASSSLRRAFLHLLMGRKFMRSLEKNQIAADRLDHALKEMLRH